MEMYPLICPSPTFNRSRLAIIQINHNLDNITKPYKGVDKTGVYISCKNKCQQTNVWILAAWKDPLFQFSIPKQKDS
jgi:hypothetical protein